MRYGWGRERVFLDLQPHDLVATPSNFRMIRHVPAVKIWIKRILTWFLIIYFFGTILYFLWWLLLIWLTDWQIV